VLLIGCGALGCTIAEQLSRAGVGFLRMVDRDIVELTNLQRQVLFDESDAAEHLPKAVAAAQRIRKINSTIRVDPVIADVDSGIVEQLLSCDDGRVDVILDGTDNVATRYLINDVSVKHDIPWVYGGCVGTEGRVMTILPGVFACLRCVFPQAPDPTTLPTCDTAGVLGPAAAVVGALQATEAIRVLTGQAMPAFVTLDVWESEFRALSLADAKREDCPACGQHWFEFLNQPAALTARLCGRNAIQIRPSRAGSLDSAAMELKLQPFGDVMRTPYFVRCALRGEGNGIELTVFADGRTIVHGTNDVRRARSIHARLVGS
jgi:adenylyltransferase/sulfurtransferase